MINCGKILHSTLTFLLLIGSEGSSVLVISTVEASWKKKACQANHEDVLERRTIWIAKIIRMSSQSINNILGVCKVFLVRERVKIKPQYVTYFRTRNGMPPVKLAKEIKRLYVDEGITAANIAKDLMVDQRTVSTKLKAMGVLLKQNHRLLPGDCKCLWCGAVMEPVW